MHVLDQFVYDNGFALQQLLDRDGLTLIRGDLRDRTTVRERLGDAEDLVLLAALVGDPICKKYPELALEGKRRWCNRPCRCTRTLGVRRLVFTSTCSNYGIHDPITLADETAS